MNIIIVSIHITAAVILVLTVLLQAGKGAGMGAAFGGSSGTVFGTRGPATLISKITCGAAVVFMCTSLNLSISQGGLNRSSIMDEWSSDIGAATPPPAAAPASAETAAPAEFAATPAPASEPAADESAATSNEPATSPESAASEVQPFTDESLGSGVDESATTSTDGDLPAEEPALTDDGSRSAE